MASFEMAQVNSLGTYNLNYFVKGQSRTRQQGWLVWKAPM